MIGWDASCWKSQECVFQVRDTTGDLSTSFDGRLGKELLYGWSSIVWEAKVIGEDWWIEELTHGELFPSEFVYAEPDRASGCSHRGWTSYRGLSLGGKDVACGDEGSYRRL
jgi:hypothetical protein